MAHTARRFLQEHLNGLRDETGLRAGVRQPARDAVSEHYLRYFSEPSVLTVFVRDWIYWQKAFEVAEEIERELRLITAAFGRTAVTDGRWASNSRLASKRVAQWLCDPDRQAGTMLALIGPAEERTQSAEDEARQLERRTADLLGIDLTSWRIDPDLALDPVALYLRELEFVEADFGRVASDVRRRLALRGLQT